MKKGTDAMILRELSVNDLDADEAEDALRHVLHASGTPTRPAWPADADTRGKLLEALAQAGVVPGEAIGDGVVARDTLQLLRQDPDRAGLRTDAIDGGRHARFDFAGSALEYMEVTTLALIALSSYVRLERGDDGRWKFVFEVRPQTDAIKTALVKLVSGLVTRLPPN